MMVACVSEKRKALCEFLVRQDLQNDDAIVYLTAYSSDSPFFKTYHGVLGNFETFSYIIYDKGQRLIVSVVCVNKL